MPQPVPTCREMVRMNTDKLWFQFQNKGRSFIYALLYRITRMNTDIFRICFKTKIGHRFNWYSIFSNIRVTVFTKRKLKNQDIRVHPCNPWQSCIPLIVGRRRHTGIRGKPVFRDAEGGTLQSVVIILYFLSAPTFQVSALPKPILFF